MKNVLLQVKKTTIDLNGNELSSSAILLQAGRGSGSHIEVTVKNGTLRADNSISAFNAGGVLTLENVDIESFGINTYAGVAAFYDGTTNIISGTITSTGRAGGVYADQTSVINVIGTKIVTEAYGVTAFEKADITIEECDIFSSTGYGVVTNGSVSKESKLTIKKSKISCDPEGNAAYFPAGIGELKECIVEGAVVICGGNITIDGGTYTAHGYATKAPYVFDEEATLELLDSLKKKDGAGNTGDSIIIIDRRMPGTGYEILSVTIKNVTFNTEFTDENDTVRTAYAIKYIDFNNKEGATAKTPTIGENTYNHKLENGSDPVLICGQN